MKYNYKDLELYEQLHKERHYGDTGLNYLEDVLSFIRSTGAIQILDFGAGTGSLAEQLHHKYNISIDQFDPCYDGKRNIPKNEYDLIITTDVLEHIYEDEIENLFEEMLSLQPKFMYHAISTRKARILLPDNSNCHKTIKSAEWWQAKIIDIVKPIEIIAEDRDDDCVVFKVII